MQPNRRNRPQTQRGNVFTSNGPDIRAKGTASQLCDKYEDLALDAEAQGDTVMFERYWQQAEHWGRIASA